MSSQPTVSCLEGKPPYNCQGCDLSGQNLSGKNLANAVLEKANLTATSFRGVTSLDGADLSGAIMGEGTDFSGCDLSKTRFGTNPNFGTDPKKPTLFVKSTLPLYSILGLTWSCLDLTDAKITDLPADLSQLSVSQCNLTRINFSNKTLANAHFGTALLHGADFTGAHLNNIVFSQSTPESEPTDLTRARFCGARIPVGVFDDAALTGVDFTGADLENASFENARMNGTSFDETNVTTCNFSSPPRFSNDRDDLTSFRGATLNYSTIKKQWSYLDLRDATLVGLDPKVDLTWLYALYANLSNMDLSNFKLTKSDFTGATLAGTKFRKATLDDAVFQGVRGAGAVFDDATMLRSNFSPDKTSGKGRPTSLRGASFNGAILTNSDFTRADLSRGNPKDPKTGSQFKSAKMNGMGLSQADLTGAQLTGGVLLHNTDLANSTLKEADLTGANLSKLSELFRVQKPSPDYQKLLQALRGRKALGVAAIFKSHGQTIDPKKSVITPTVPDRSWTVRSSTSQYTVLNWTSSDKSTFLVVFSSSGDARAATLTGAYMPDAVLSDAHLIGVEASGVELYGSGAKLDGATLDGIVLTKANLGSLNLVDAALYGAKLNYASLINAKLNRASFEGATLAFAHLQGADFTDVALDGVDLSNAAVAVKEGVCLFGLGRNSDPGPPAVLAELGAAADPRRNFTLSEEHGEIRRYTADLDRGDLKSLRPIFLKKGVKLSKGASVVTEEAGAAWQVNDPPPSPGHGAAFTVFTGTTDLGDPALLARPSLPLLRQVFADSKIVLHWQATVTAAAPKRWQIDNDSENPKNLQLGYMKYLILAANDGALSFYGKELRIERLAAAGRLEVRMVQYPPTNLCRTGGDGQQGCKSDGSGSVFGMDTICPNTRKLSTNQREKVPWEQMLRAPEPPRPPDCVPSPFAYCPPPGHRDAARTQVRAPNRATRKEV